MLLRGKTERDLTHTHTHKKECTLFFEEILFELWIKNRRKSKIAVIINIEKKRIECNTRERRVHRQKFAFFFSLDVRVEMSNCQSFAGRNRSLKMNMILVDTKRN